MDTSRVEDPSDNSIRPSRDTGFRMAEQPPFSYEPRQNPPSRAFIDYLHNDDMIDAGHGTLRGQVLNAVRAYHINYEKAEKRAVGEIRRNVMRRQGATPCLCMLPGTVPCTDCGAGL